MKRTGKALLALGLTIMLAMSAIAGYAADAAVQVDLYFENGVVYTVDADDSVAEALAVKDGRIVFVGSAADGQAYKEAAAEVVDLAGGMLLPGFIDGHIHIASPDFFDFSLAGIMELDSTMKAIAEYVAANPDKESYYGFGYLTSIFEGEELQKGPTKERLDEICPDKPMVIAAYDGHSMWLNSKAFEMIGISKDSDIPSGGQVTLHDDTGEVWGTLRDSAMAMVPNVSVPEEKLASALQNYFGGLNSLGYTSIMTLSGNGFMPLPLEGLVKLEAEDLLTVRVRGGSIVTGWNPEETLAALAAQKDQYQSDLVKVIGAKFFADGVMDNASAHVIEPYQNDAHSHGNTDWKQEDMNKAMAAVNEMGLLTHTHAIGDAAVRMALDALAYAKEHAPQGDYRNAITHLQLVEADDIQRFAELDVVAVAQPYWHMKQPDFWEPVEYATLGERAEHEYPMQSFLDAGVTLAFASDYPVTVNPNPFIAIEMAVTRNLANGAEYGVEDITDMDDPRYLLWPEERVSINDAIRGFTASGAYAIHEDHETGTLEVGKSADLIVINQDLLTIPSLDISDTQVLRTYLQGRLVYDAEEME